MGSGSYIFGVPSSTYWVAETYAAPQLTVVFNNGGWNAPKASTLLVHPEGTAERRDRYWITTSARARQLTWPRRRPAPRRFASSASMSSTPRCARRAGNRSRRGEGAVVDDDPADFGAGSRR